MLEHVRLLESGEHAAVARDEGNAEEVVEKAPTGIDATYALPYLAHAAMEPNNAACRMREDGVLEVWASTESPEWTRISASEAAGIEKEQVEVHVTLAGGSFGLHSTSGGDPMSEAVHVARALDWEHPIKVQSLREEDFKAGRYRAMALHRVRAGANSEGRLTAYHHQIVAEPTSVNLPFVREVMFKNGVDFFTTTGAVDPPYKFENFKLESTNFESGVPTMVWRSVGNSHTEFARESAIDELAIAVGRDSVDLRRELLTDTPRTLHALELAAEIADWGTAPPEGRARGVTCSNFLSHCANVTEVSLDDRERVHVDRIVFVLDCGMTVNPDLVPRSGGGGTPVRAERRGMGRGGARRRRRDRHPELRSLPDRANALRPADRGPPDQVDRVANRGRRGCGALSGPGPGERDRRPHRHSHPPAPTLQDHQDRLRKEDMPDVTITPTEDGPYMVSGPVVLTAPDGRVIEHPDPMMMCRCGHSSNKPFCDGTHATIDFDGTLAN